MGLLGFLPDRNGFFMADQVKMTTGTMAEVRLQIQRIEESYVRLERGEQLPPHELRAIPSLAQIRHSLSRQSRYLADAEDLIRRDQFIRQHVISEMLEKVEAATGPEQRAFEYALLLSALEKYELTPKTFLRDLYLTDEDYQGLGRVFKEAAISYVRQGLQLTYETAALSQEDRGILSDDRAPESVKLNALFRPVADGHARAMLDALESALVINEPDAEITDYVDEITPDNVFFNAPEKAEEKPLSARDEAARAAVGKALSRVARATSPVEMADCYAGFRGSLSIHGLTLDRFVSLYRFKEVQDRIRDVVREAVLVFVNVRFRKAIKEMPSPEDQQLVNDSNARPIDRLNALFRNTGTEAVSLLSALEEAGFDFEEEGLTQRILAAGTVETPAAKSAPRPL